MEKFCKRLRIIGLLINSAAGGLMGWLFDGTKLVIALAILILGMLGMSFVTFAIIKLEEKSVFVYYHPRLNEMAITRANIIEEAVENFEGYFEEVEKDYIYEAFCTEIDPTKIIEKGENL